jgi:UDP-N-acetylglucosamine--dolichyl-phosphate N-acetylglucosaminephosphotransferase
LPSARFDSATGLLYPSTATFTKPPSALTTVILRLFKLLHFVQLTYSSDGKTIVACTNLTILNMILCLSGPMKEPSLTKAVMAVQIGGSILAFVIRYAGAGLFYESNRR